MPFRTIIAVVILMTSFTLNERVIVQRLENRKVKIENLCCRRTTVRLYSWNGSVNSKTNHNESVGEKEIGFIFATSKVPFSRQSIPFVFKVTQGTRRTYSLQICLLELRNDDFFNKN